MEVDHVDNNEEGEKRSNIGIISKMLLTEYGGRLYAGSERTGCNIRFWVFNLNSQKNCVVSNLDQEDSGEGRYLLSLECWEE